jgi:NADH-quinone oxidoreductase subunit J
MNTLFYLSAVIAVVATLLVITSRNAVHAILYLVVSLLAVAMVFFTLGAPLVAALEVIVYAGAIIVLFVFVVMMVNLSPHRMEEEYHAIGSVAWIGPSVLGLVLIAELVYVLAQQGLQPIGASYAPPKLVGTALLVPYLLGLELASVVLLAGLVGAYHLGRRLDAMEDRSEEKQDDSL